MQVDLQRGLGQVDIVQAEAAEALPLGGTGDTDIVEAQFADAAGQAYVDRAVGIDHRGQFAGANS